MRKVEKQPTQVQPKWEQSISFLNPAGTPRGVKKLRGQHDKEVLTQVVSVNPPGIHFGLSDTSSPFLVLM